VCAKLVLENLIGRDHFLDVGKNGRMWGHVTKFFD
jgi:hypothetical protein